MPLIALDILENKVKELILTMQHLKDENMILKNQLEIKPGISGEQTISPQMLYELETLRQEVLKLKNQKKLAYNRVYAIIGKLDNIINKATASYIDEDE